MPAHWLRPGVVADIETFLDELARKAKHGQDSKFGFPGSRDAQRHVAKLMKAPVTENGRRVVSDIHLRRHVHAPQCMRC